MQYTLLLCSKKNLLIVKKGCQVGCADIPGWQNLQHATLSLYVTYSVLFISTLFPAMAFAKSNLCRFPEGHRDDVSERVRRDRYLHRTQVQVRVS
jgi:hypothetical protein